MRTKILFIIIVITFVSFAQQVYEVIPGTKGNEITLELSNISGVESADDLEVKIVKNYSHLIFTESSKWIDKIEVSSEKEVTFFFDVKYNTNVNKADTLEFLITDNKKIYLTKTFIFNYAAPKEYSLEQNYPNPFNPSTKIRYTVPASPKSSPKERTLNGVILIVYDILGNQVATLVNEKKEPGYYEVDFNGSNLASGVYIYRLNAADFVSVKKMMLIK